MEITIKTTMMMMMNKRSALIILFSFFAAVTFSQKKDFGIWYGISAEHKFSNKIELDLATCFRTYKDASELEEAFLEAGVTYKFNKYLSASGSYRFTENIEKDDNAFHIRHKLFADLKGSLPVGRFDMSLRLRFQERFKTYYEDEEDKIPDSHGRIRFKTQYDIPSFPLNPYVSAEIFIPMFTETTRSVDKNRFEGGVEYSFNKKHSIELEYMLQRDYLPKLSDISVISVNYSFDF